jgi:hypothetical protein
MPQVGFQPTVPASERAKTVHALDHSATVTASVLERRYISLMCGIRVEEFAAWATQNKERKRGRNNIRGFINSAETSHIIKGVLVVRQTVCHHLHAEHDKVHEGELTRTRASSMLRKYDVWEATKLLTKNSLKEIFSISISFIQRALTSF